MTTAADLIAQALKIAGVLGVGQAAMPEDVNDALTHLNQMIGQWNRKRWLVYHLIDTPLTSTGAASYTVGAGGDFDIPRPDRLEAAYVRQLISGAPNLVDYPLTVLASREDYSRIRLKSLTTWPETIFYDSAIPLGVVYPHPIPQAALFELHLVTKDTLASFAVPATAVTLPPEYLAALQWNLAVRLRSAYQMPADPVAVGLAKDALAVIRIANTQIPRLRMPAGIAGSGIYNIFSDGR
jgi:hypothetical protein